MKRWTHCLRADVWVPDLGLESHAWWSEGVLARDLDVHEESTALVWCIWWPEELAAQMCEVIAVPCGLYLDLRELVVLNIGDFFGDTSGTIGGHGGSGTQPESKLVRRNGRGWVGEGSGSEWYWFLDKVSLRLERQQLPSGADSAAQRRFSGAKILPPSLSRILTLDVLAVWRGLVVIKST